MEASQKTGKAFKVNSFFVEQDSEQEGVTSGAIVTVSFSVTEKRSLPIQYIILLKKQILTGLTLS